MALNIAVPLSGVSDFMEGFGLLSPISPISVDCREHLKLLVSPVSSESSGVSSFDSDESKEKKAPIVEPTKPVVELKIFHNGRDILDLHQNLTDSKWNLQTAILPQQNVQMYFANRSQYHRLGKSGHIQEYSLTTCHESCGFKYPVHSFGDDAKSPNGTTTTSSAATSFNSMLCHPPPITTSSSFYKMQFANQNNNNNKYAHNNNNNNNNINNATYGYYRQF